MALTALLIILNYRGIRLSATFQNWTTFGTLALFIVFVAAGVSHGSLHNAPPLFTHAPLVSILLVLQIVPYYMTGFESVGKASEEASAGFSQSKFLVAIWMAIVVGTVFYVVVVAAVSVTAPWQSFTSVRFMTAAIFQQATGSRWVVNAILAAAVLSLVKCFNGNFVAATRLLTGLSRKGLIPQGAAQIHPVYQTPSAAVLLIGLGTAIGMLLGDAILVPITEVGSVAAAFGWTAACAAYLTIIRRGSNVTRDSSAARRVVACCGLLVGAGLIFMKIAPIVPGHFSRAEWLALAIWVALGVVAAKRRVPGTIGPTETPDRASR